MEKFTALLVPALLAVMFVRLMLIPMKWIYRIGIHSICGFACLWLLNSISAVTGIFFPINAVTILVAGFLGIPGMAVMALLAVMA